VLNYFYILEFASSELFSAPISLSFFTGLLVRYHHNVETVLFQSFLSTNTSVFNFAGWIFFHVDWINNFWSFLKQSNSW